MGEPVLLNHYPCTVVTTLGTKNRTRLVVTAEKADVWELVGNEPTITQSVSVASFESLPRRSNRDRFALTTTEGESWEIRKDCAGCSGGKLKAFDPLGGARRVGT